MTDLGFKKDSDPEIVAHRTKMDSDNAGKPWDQWPHKVKSAGPDGGGTWTTTCESCGITWKTASERSSGAYHGD